MFRNKPAGMMDVVARRTAREWDAVTREDREFHRAEAVREVRAQRAAFGARESYFAERLPSPGGWMQILR